VRDGNGDIGLESSTAAPLIYYKGNIYSIGELDGDILEPYNVFDVIRDSPTNSNVTISNGHSGPYVQTPVFQAPITYLLFKGRQNQRDIFDTVHVDQTIIDAGSRRFFSNSDERPLEYSCEDYEILSFYRVDQEVVNDVVLSENLIKESDTVFVKRNPFHFNIFIEFQIKSGGTYTVFPIGDCDPGYTARYPLFKRSNIGRPLVGSISYGFFSLLFQDPESSPLLNETLRIRFYIYDRELNQSNEVFTPDFKLLELRQGDLVGN
jgi:hypothetical protein